MRVAMEAGCRIAVLVVSDCNERHTQLADMLLTHDYTPMCVSDGAAVEAAILNIRQISNAHVDMIAALRGVGRQNDKVLHPCATLALLHDDHCEALAGPLAAGAVDCLRHPVETESLFEALAHAVSCTRRWRQRIRPLGRVEALSAPVAAPASGRVGVDTEARIESLVERLAGEHALTTREREVLYWLLRGHRYDDIGVALGVAPRTAKFHAANLMRKLNLDSRYDLPRLLVEFNG